MTATHICWFLLAGLAVYSLFRIQRHLRRLVFRVEQTLNFVQTIGAAAYRKTSAPPAKEAPACLRRT